MVMLDLAEQLFNLKCDDDIRRSERLIQQLSLIHISIAIPINIRITPIRSRVILISIFLMSIKITIATAISAEPYMRIACMPLPP